MFKSFSFLNWICVLLMGASLVITTGCSKDKKGGGTAKAPTTVPYMHPNFRVAVVIRPQQLLKSELVTSVTEKIPGNPLAEMTGNFKEETGLNLAQVQRVVVLSNSFMPAMTSSSSEKGSPIELDEESSAPEPVDEDGEGKDAPQRNNGANLERSESLTGTFPVAQQDSDSAGPSEPIGINEADMFPAVSPFFCIVIDVDEGVDLTAVAEKITSNKTTTKEGDHSYYSNSDGKDKPSVCVVTKTTLLLAEEPHMKKILATGNSDSALSQELKTLENTNDVSAVVLVGDVVRDMRAEDSLEQLGSAPNPLVPAQISQTAGLVKDIQAVTVALSLGSETPLQVNLNTSSSEVAEKFTSSLEDLKKMGQEQLGGQDAASNPFAEIANKAINGLTIGSDGGHVSVALKMSPEDLQKTVETALSFILLFGPIQGGESASPEAVFEELDPAVVPERKLPPDEAP